MLKLQTGVVYHAIFGDRERATKAINDTIALASQAPPSSALAVVSLLIALLGRWIVEPRLSSHFELCQAFEDCQRAKVNSLCHRIAARLSIIYFDDGEIEESKRWARLARDTAKELGLERLCADYLTSQTDLALISGRFDEARSIVNQMASRNPLTSTARVASEQLVYRIRLAQFTGNLIPDEDQMRELLSWHDRARFFGRYDDHMEILWTALRAMGDEERAAALLREYMSESRRELRPPSYLLRWRTAEDPYWSSVD